MSAQDILKMIEEVDPSDTAKLDEIDARVHHLLVTTRLGSNLPCDERWFKARKKNGDCPQYTRSRDALKTIRPDGWSPSFRAMTHDIERDLYCSELMTQDGWVQSKFVPTEELAELHAILQAIAYERSQK